MLRWVRRQLRLMEYYSATRQRTVWSRAADATLVSSMVLALPVTWWFDHRMEQSITIHGVTGLIDRDEQGALVAYVNDPESYATDYGIPRDRIHAYFTVEVDRLDRGFPMRTTQVTRQPIITVRQFRDRDAVWRSTDGTPTPESQAVVSAVQNSPLPPAAAIRQRWAEGDVRTQVNHWAWAASVFLWWIGLFVALSLGLLLTRVTVGSVLYVRAVRRQALRAEGRCPSCAYDLRGLEFSPRCPECGELQT